MVGAIRESGKMDSEKEQAQEQTKREVGTSDSIKKTKNTGLDVKFGKMGINMKESGRMEKNTDQGLKPGKMEISIRDTIRMIKSVELESIMDLKGIYSKANGWVEREMEILNTLEKREI